MRRHRITTLVVLLLAVLCGTGLKTLPRTVPFEQCSEVFQRYCATPGVKAAFIKDFPVNDSISFDLITLQATDSLAWYTLKHDFGINEPTQAQKEQIANGEDLFVIQKEQSAETTADSDPEHLNTNIFTASHLNQSITIYHIENRNQLEAIIYYQLSRMTIPINT